MARFPLAIPPGIYRNGPVSQSRGRWYAANLVRFEGNVIKPVGGWRTRAAGTVTGAPRASLTWKDNSAITWMAIGTHSNLYISNRSGTLFDITPSGFSAGRATAVAAGGYGSGTYGTGTYGTPRLDSTLVTDATQWTLDRFGERLVGISPDDGKPYEWALNTAVIAAQISGAPTGKALVVTPEGFLFILATTDPRTFSWCDQRNNTLWTPSGTNQAGNYPLQTTGRLMCGKVVQGGTLLFTDIDVWQATYVPNNNVYETKKKGDACGAISRQAVASFEMKAVWMSPDFHFWQFNGYVQPVECDVRDYIISDINKLQVSKIHAIHNAANFEVEFYYCSSGSSEIDRCVVWTYAGPNAPYWNIGRKARTCGSDSGVFLYPTRVDISGLIYDHEVGTSYDSAQPYIEGGPVVLGNGDNVMDVMGLYPDDNTVGDVTATFYSKNNPDDAETTYGPYTLTSKTDLRFPGRSVRPRFDGSAMSSWRVGTPSLELTGGGKR